MKRQCLTKINQQLRTALRNCHAQPGVTQEKLAERLRISVRACSALENAEQGFSVYTAFGTLALLPFHERLQLLIAICSIFDDMNQQTA